jgi:hypothetical protein
MKKNTFEKFTESYNSEEEHFNFTNKLIQNEIKELQLGIVRYGDGDLAKKAKYILELGTEQIISGKPPHPAFMNFVTSSIRKVLSGEESSLDRAFGLTLPRRRPNKDPENEDKVVYAFIGSMHENRELPENERIRISLEHAFKTHYGKEKKEYVELQFDKKSIDDRMTETKKILKKRGYY